MDHHHPLHCLSNRDNDTILPSSAVERLETSSSSERRRSFVDAATVQSLAAVQEEEGKSQDHHKLPFLKQDPLDNNSIVPKKSSIDSAPVKTLKEKTTTTTTTTTTTMEVLPALREMPATTMMMAPPRMARRASTGTPTTSQQPQAQAQPHRTKARRQSGVAVTDIHASQDLFLKKNRPDRVTMRSRAVSDDYYNRPILLLDRNDSIRLIKSNMDESFEDHSDRHRMNNVTALVVAGSTPIAGPGAGPGMMDTSANSNSISNSQNSMGDDSSGSLYYNMMDGSDQVMRIRRRRKPRRQSGDAVETSTLESLKSDMPCLLQRENSVHLIKQRLPSRRASMTF